MSTGRWMDKKAVVHIHNGILPSYKKKCIWVSSNEVDETGACSTKWNKSERERQILYISIYMAFRKMMPAILHAGYQRRHRCKEQTFGLCGRRRGWDGLENSIETCIIICKLDERKFNAWSRAPKASALGQPRGLWFEGRWGRFRMRGTHVYLWPIHFDVWQKPLQYCKVIIL